MSNMDDWQHAEAVKRVLHRYKALVEELHRLQGGGPKTDTILSLIGEIEQGIEWLDEQIDLNKSTWH